VNGRDNALFAPFDTDFGSPSLSPYHGITASSTTHFIHCK
jgi:hypothetical protein